MATKTTPSKTPSKTSFTRANCLGFANEVLAALAPIAEKYGLKISHGNVKYSEHRLGIPIELVVADVDPTLVAGTKERDFAQNARFVGLKSEDLGREFMSGGKLFKITGFNTKARTMPIQAECITDGKRYKFASERIQEIFARQDAQKAG